MRERDGHIRILPLHVANKIAAGEVVERPASVVKELVENAIDAGASRISISIVQGGRKLVAVQDDGCGMTRDDALLSLERQATSKILDVDDIESIDTLGFRGEAIPSIASVSRFSLTTRRRDADEGTRIDVSAGALLNVSAAGAPPGTLVEVKDLFCNVPARRKFLRAYATEESHVRHVFTVHALAHPGISFSLAVDGREVCRLAPARSAGDRIRDLFGPDFAHNLLEVDEVGEKVAVSGFIERPNLAFPSRREQYIFVNGRPATAPAIASALRDAYPRRQGDARPAAILFISLSPKDVDVNVHPTKREIRFRDNSAVRKALMAAIASAIGNSGAAVPTVETMQFSAPPFPAAPGPAPAAQEAKAAIGAAADPAATAPACSAPEPPRPSMATASPRPAASPSAPPPPPAPVAAASGGAAKPPSPAPVEQALPMAAAEDRAKPWAWFKFLATTDSGYLLLETDSGIVTVNPRAARERIAFERLMAQGAQAIPSQPLLIPETVQLPPADFHRIANSIEAIRGMGFRIEPFGQGTFKIDAVPQIVGNLPCEAILASIAGELASPSPGRGDRWRAEIVAKSIARAYAGASAAIDREGAMQLVEELISCRMPYICPRGKCVMIFTSTRELDRKFGRL